MNDQELEQHLSQMLTNWDLLNRAHQEADATARDRLLQRYTPAIYRYLLASVRDRDVADDLFQDFALRFVRGDFRRADPRRGRFRDLLKTSVYHLIVDHQRRQKKAPGVLRADAPEPAEELSVLDSDREFIDQWRTELLNRAWKTLQEMEQAMGQPLYTLLKYRTDHPDARSAEMAEQFAGQVGKPITAEWIRKRLHLAREKFTDFLLQEVEQSLDSPSAEELEQEVVDLGLMEYCRAGLKRRRDN